MTPAEGDVLAKRIINTWHGGPPLADWREVFAPLDAGRAGTAYARLRAKLEHAPSIAKFMAAYQALDTRGPEHHEDCGHCDGTGWIDAPDRIHPDGRHSTQVKPCGWCDEGRAREATSVWRNRRHETSASSDDERLFG